MNWRDFKTLDAYIEALRNKKEEEERIEKEKLAERIMMECKAVKSAFRRQFKDVYDRIEKPQISIYALSGKMEIGWDSHTASFYYRIENSNITFFKDSEAIVKMNADWLVEQLIK